MNYVKMQGKYDEIVLKAQNDPAFKQRFLADPDVVLLEHGIRPPTGKKIKIVENSKSVVHLILPAPSVLTAEDVGLPGTGFCSWRKQDNDA